MRKTTIIGLLISLTLDCLAQKQLTSYEYWFNTDYSARINVPINPTATVNVVRTIPTIGLPAGLWVFNIRFQDNMGAWSPSSSQFFLKPVLSEGHHQITKYEYWFDSDVTLKTSQLLLSEDSVMLIKSLSTKNLPVGLHLFNLRFGDNKGAWSPTISHFFIKTPTSTGHHQLVKYEYWFDSDFANKINQTIESADSVLFVHSFATRLLPAGVHVFNIRFADNRSAWSPVVSQFFYKPVLQENVTDNKTTGYRYWFEKNSLKPKTITVEPTNPLLLNGTLIPVTAIQRATPDNYKFLPDNNNENKTTYHLPTLFNIQFIDRSGQWSSVSTDTFMYEYTVGVKCDTLLTFKPLTKNIPLSDTIHFFVTKAMSKDTLVFDINKSLTVDLYDSSGKLLKTIIGNGLTTSDKLVVESSGDYYALVRHFNSLSGNYTFSCTNKSVAASLKEVPLDTNNRVTVFPDLAGSDHKIRVEVRLPGKNLTDYRITIYTIFGQQICQINRLDSKMSINLPTHGFYLLKLSDRQGMTIDRIKFVSK